MSSPFSSNWYASAYPDVAASGLDPRTHYQTIGAAEGRFPRAMDSSRLESALWVGFSAYALPRLQERLQSHATASDERAYAAWALARWHSANQEWEQGSACLAPLLGPLPSFIDHLGPRLLAADLLLRTRQSARANALIRAHLDIQGPVPDLCLAAANARLRLPEKPAAHPDDCRLDWINRAITRAGLAPLQKRRPRPPLSLDNLQGQARWANVSGDAPKISVIVPAYNAADTIATAIRGLCDQSWRNLEILVVDDASTDDTFAIVRKLAEQDPRIIPLRQPLNRGAYAARNRGLQQATGVLITNHDSDDWSHPERLERQANALLASNAVASIADWVRCDPHLYAQHWRIERSLIHKSMSTLMYRSEILDNLGGWDEVRVCADTELYFRILHTWGESALARAMEGAPLAFGAVRTGSLTTTSATHHKTELHGARRLYLDLAAAWANSLPPNTPPRIIPGVSTRLFPAPAAVLGELERMRVYDWLILADASAQARHARITRALLHALMQQQPAARIALFHWADAHHPQSMHEEYLELSVSGVIDIVLAQQKLTAQHHVLVGSYLQAQPPDQLPDADLRRLYVIDSLAELEPLHLISPALAEVGISLPHDD